jgi:hydroxyethylthiazole kinase-like uncharacterized protein yjeF
MRHGYTTQQVRDAEATHLAAGEPLMARAALGLAAAVRDLLTGRTRVLVLVGSGNNGGDALFAGAHLAASGCDVRIIQVGSRVHETGLAAAVAAGAQVSPAQDAAELAAASGVIVDGILGTGATASPALRGRGRDTVAAILPVLEHAGRPTVVAVDIPSGIHPDDGTVPDPVVLPADVTVTVGACKVGLLRGPAVALCGQVRVVPIGIEDDLARLTPAITVP